MHSPLTVAKATTPLYPPFPLPLGKAPSFCLINTNNLSFKTSLRYCLFYVVCLLALRDQNLLPPDHSSGLYVPCKYFSIPQCAMVHLYIFTKGKRTAFNFGSQYPGTQLTLRNVDLTGLSIKGVSEYKFTNTQHVRAGEKCILHTF